MYANQDWNNYTGEIYSMRGDTDEIKIDMEKLIPGKKAPENLDSWKGVHFYR